MPVKYRIRDIAFPLAPPGVEEEVIISYEVPVPGTPKELRIPRREYRPEQIHEYVKRDIKLKGYDKIGEEGSV